MAGIDIQIIEYHNGKPMHFYDGLQECATAFHCHTELIKGLIFTGQAFPYLEESITFDIHPSCNCRIVRRKKKKDAEVVKSTRYYTFDIIGNNEDEKVEKVEKGGETTEGRDE